MDTEKELPYVSSVSSVGAGKLIIKLPEVIILPRQYINYLSTGSEIDDPSYNKYGLDNSAVLIEVANN